MKIIFITREGYNLPGARIRCYNFAKELSRYGIDTRVFSFSDTLGAKDGQAESQMGISQKLKFNYAAFRRLLSEKGAIFYLQRFNYHSFAPYLVHLIKGNKIILDLDDWEMRDDPKYYFFYPTSKAHFFTRAIAKRSLFCVAASRFLQDFLKPFNRQVYYIPTGVDTRVFFPSLNKSNTNEIVFSWIGTFHKKEYVENIEFALECFSLLRKQYGNIYLDIVGEGIYNNNVLEAVEKFKDRNIRKLCWIPPDKIPAYLSGIHIGLFPVASDTKFNRAKSPTKLFEYMAMGKAVIASSTGESSYIIKDGYNGMLADSKEEFVEKMRNLIEDQGLRQLLGQRSAQTIKEEFSLEVIGKQLCAALRQIG